MGCTDRAVAAEGYFLKQAGACAKKRCTTTAYRFRSDSLLRVVRQAGYDIVYTSQRDALPFRRNSLKIRIVYAIGCIVWRIFGYNLAPGFVFIARKRSS